MCEWGYFNELTTLRYRWDSNRLLRSGASVRPGVQFGAVVPRLGGLTYICLEACRRSWPQPLVMDRPSCCKICSAGVGAVYEPPNKGEEIDIHFFFLLIEAVITTPEGQGAVMRCQYISSMLE